MKFFKFLQLAILLATTASMDRSSILKLVNEALSLHKSGAVSEALEKYSNVVKHCSGNVASTLYSNMGSIYMGSFGDYENAREYFQLSVEAQPENYQSHYNLAVLLTSKFNSHAKALKHCKLSLKYNPENHKALHLLGNILQSMGFSEEADKYFVEAEAAALTAGSQTSASSSSSSSEWTLADIPIFNSKLNDVVSVSTEDGRLVNMRCVSERPLVFLVPNLLTSDECNHIIERSKESLSKSFIMGGGSGDIYRPKPSEHDNLRDESAASAELEEPYRSSFTAWLSVDSTLELVQRRLANLLSFPVAYLQAKSEELQVVRYERDGQFNLHQDASAFSPRLFTALFYLNNVTLTRECSSPEEAESEDSCSTFVPGATWFPFAMSEHVPESVEASIEQGLRLRAEALPPSQQLPGLVIPPRQGQAVIFFNFHPAVGGGVDPAAVHAGLPVRGSLQNVETNESEDLNLEKWVANYWVHLDLKRFQDLALK